MADSSEKAGPSSNTQNPPKNEIAAPSAKPSSMKKRKREEDEKNERHKSGKGKEKQEKPVGKKVSFQVEITNKSGNEEKTAKEIATPNDERENSILKKKKESSIVEDGSKKNEKMNDEAKNKQSSLEIELTNEVLDHSKYIAGEYIKPMLSEGKQEFWQENKIMMAGFKNELRRDNSLHYIIRPFNFDLESSYYIRQDMIEMPLTNLEMKQLKEKWRQVKEVELEAWIGRLALMNEELQMKMARVRTELNDKSKSS